MGDLMLLLGATAVVGKDSAALIEACLFLPLGVLLSVVVIEVFSGGRKGVDLDKAIVVLLVTGSLLFFVGAFLTFSPASDLGQQIAVKAAGAGVLLGRTSLAENELKEGRLVTPFELKLKSNFSFFAVTADHRKDEENIRKFLDWLLDEIEGRIEPAKSLIQA